MTIAAAATATFAVIWLLRLLLPAHFLVSEVTGRSNHDHHARQIGGLAIVPVVAALMAAGTAAGLPSGTQSVAVSAAASAFGLLGLFDDLTDAGTRMRLFAQVVIAVTFVLGAGFAPAFLHAWMPAALASALVVVFLVGAVNMANFMDGLDLMSVAGLGLPLLAIGLIGSAGPHASGTYVAAALAGGGALLGFGFHNRPPAPVFLGDSGSLAAGFLAGYVTLSFADAYGVAAAVLPFAYYFVDSASTLALRALRGENVMHSHSGHAYQQARRNGMSVTVIVAAVAAINIALAAICAIAIHVGNGLFSGIAAVFGFLICGVFVVRLRQAGASGS